MVVFFSVTPAEVMVTLPNTSTVIPEVTVKTPAYLEDNTPLDYGLKTITFDAEEESKLDLAGRIKEVVNLTPGSTIQVAKGTVEKMSSAAVESITVPAILAVRPGRV